MVRAAQKGEMENPSSEVLDAAGSMKVSDVKKFAKTKHKGLPAKVKEEYVIEREGSPYEKASSGALKGKTRNTEAKEKEHKTSFRRKAHRNSAAMIIKAKRKAERSGKKLSDDSAADLAHKGWASSVKHHKSSMTPEQQKRRQKLADTPYKKLSKDEQDKDKVSAKAIMSVHDQQKKKTVKEGTSIIQGRSSSKKVGYRGPTGDHKRDKDGNIVASHYDKKDTSPPVKIDGTKIKYKKVKKSNKPKQKLPWKPKTPEERKEILRKFDNYQKTKGGALTNKKKVNEATISIAAKANTAIKNDERKKKLEKVRKTIKAMRKHGDAYHPFLHEPKESFEINEIAPAIAMAGKAILSGGVKKAAAGAVKQKAKQAVKQKAAEVAGNVADKISKPIGGTRVQESKGTAELAGLALRGKKRCAHCGSFTHVTGQCPKKDHGVVNKRTITSEAKEEEGRSDYGKASVRNKRRFGKEGKPAIFDPTNERGKMIDKRREEHQKRQAKSGVTEGVMDIVRKYTDKKKPEKKAEKAQDAGARLRRKVERRVHAKYVSGSEDNVPDDIRDHKTWNDFKKHIN